MLLSHFSLFLQIYCREKSKCTGTYPLSLSLSSSLQEASCIRVGSSGTHFRRDSRLLPFQRWKGMNPHAAPERICVSLWQNHDGVRDSRRYWIMSSCFVKRTQERALLFCELSRGTAAIILSRRNWFAKTLCQPGWLS